MSFNIFKFLEGKTISFYSIFQTDFHCNKVLVVAPRLESIGNYFLREFHYSRVHNTIKVELARSLPWLTRYLHPGRQFPPSTFCTEKIFGRSNISSLWKTYSVSKQTEGEHFPRSRNNLLSFCTNTGLKNVYIIKLKK